MNYIKIIKTAKRFHKYSQDWIIGVKQTIINVTSAQNPYSYKIQPEDISVQLIKSQNQQFKDSVVVQMPFLEHQQELAVYNALNQYFYQPDNIPPMNHPYDIIINWN